MNRIKLICVGALSVWVWQLSTMTVAIPIPASTLITQPPSQEPVLAYETAESDGVTAVVFTGDIMLGRHVERLSQSISSEYPFTGLSLTTLAADVAVVGNFEASVPAIHVPTPNYHLRFSVPANTLGELKNAGFEYVSLANNHAYDFGSEGYAHTVAAMDAHGLTSFGNPYTVQDSSVAYIPTPYGQIALVGINQTFGTVNLDDVSAVLAAAASQSVKQIVYIHWGDEYTLTHSAAQKRFATQLVEAGADLIIGHHPHVVQDIDTINGVPVVYSLGNYIFDQYFSYNVQVGLVVVLELSDQSSTLTLHPITSIGTPARPRLKTEAERQLFLESLASRSHRELTPDIRSGTISVPWQFATSSKTAMIGQ